MAEDQVERRLAAIMAADVVGYSRLIGADELGTLTRLKGLRRGIIDPLIAGNHGRIVKEIGDGFLVEFASVVEAVRSAIEIQRALAKEASTEEEDEPIRFRIGINLGDVIVEGSDLFGDGVNIAARMENLADPGGICITRGAFDYVRGKVDAVFEDMGEQELKNIAQPVHVFRHIPGIDASAAQPLHAEKPGKPSVAVLPIENISGSVDLDAFAAGLSEDLIAALAETSELTVAPRNMSFPLRGKSQGTHAIARQLGVGSVLEGRVQGTAQRLRITLQLIDGATGNFIWAERYDSEIADIFALQDDIVRKTLIGIRSKLISGDQARIAASGTQNLTAWLRCNEAFEEWAKFSSDSNVRAIELFRMAHEADPAWSHPLAGLTAAYGEAAVRGWGASRKQTLAEAEAFGRRAIEIGPNNPSGYAYLATVRINNGKVKEGIALCEKAVEIAPNDFGALNALGWSLPRVGEFTRSLAVFARSRRNRPTPSGAVLANEAFVAHLAGLRERAVDLLSQCLEHTNIIDAHIRLAALYTDLGRLDEARAEVSRILARQPDATIEEYTKNLPFPDSERLKWYRGLLIAAGLQSRP